MSGGSFTLGARDLLKLGYYLAPETRREADFFDDYTSKTWLRYLRET